MPKSHLNTNKQFMVMNGVLAFAVLIVVAVFVYMSLRLSHKQDEQAQQFAETYDITLSPDFAGDSLQLLLNDSLIYQSAPGAEGVKLRMKRFAETTSLLVVDKVTDRVAVFELAPEGENLTLVKRNGDIVKR